MTIESGVTRKFDGQAIDKIEPQVQHCLRSYQNDDLREDKLIDLVEEWFFKGYFIEEGIDVPDGVTVNRRLDAEAMDKIEQQVQDCLQIYENDLLEEKLIALAQEWFFKGLFIDEIMDVADGVTDYSKLKQEQKG